MSLECPFDGAVPASELMRYLTDTLAKGMQLARFRVPGAAGLRRGEMAPSAAARLVSVDLRFWCPIVVRRS